MNNYLIKKTFDNNKDKYHNLIKVIKLKFTNLQIKTSFKNKLSIFFIQKNFLKIDNYKKF